MSSSKEIIAKTKVYWQTDTISIHSENKQGLNHPHKRLLIVLAVECVGGSKNPCQWRAAKPRRKLPDLGPIGQSRIYPCTSDTLYDPFVPLSAGTSLQLCRYTFQTQCNSACLRISRFPADWARTDRRSISPISRCLYYAVNVNRIKTSIAETATLST